LRATGRNAQFLATLTRSLLAAKVEIVEQFLSTAESMKLDERRKTLAVLKITSTFRDRLDATL